jgi:zinc protease
VVIRQTEVDGVPTLVAPTTGPTHAGLVFRVGQADETLARRGITHLLEHLVLHPVGLADYHYNGMTGAVVTHFHLRGSVDDITAFLTGVCRSLARLDMDRLDTERSIVLTEQSSRVTGATSAMPMWRHGARDHGLVSFPEWGVHGITAGDLRSWAASHFTRDNAVLWIAGDDVPSGLSLDLPEGRRRPVPSPSSALPSTPAYFTGSAHSTAVDTVVRRRPAGPVFAGVLERQLFRTLRQEGGMSYTAATDYSPRGDGYAVVTALADALPEKHEAVLGGFVEVLAALRAGRIDDADVASVVSKAADSLGTQETDAARLPSVAFDLLVNEPVRAIDEVVTDLKAVTAEDVHAVATEALATALLMTPHGRKADWAGYSAAPTSSTGAVDGTTYAGIGDASDRLIVGPDGVTRTWSSGEFATVRFDSCVAVLALPDGARQLVGADGINVRIEPTLYRDGGRIAIDERVPPGVRVDLPARDPSEIPAPAPSTTATATPVRSAADIRHRITVGVLAILTAVMGVAALVVSIGMAIGAFEPRVLGIIGIWIIAGWLGRTFLKEWRGD